MPQPGGNSGFPKGPPLPHLPLAHGLRDFGAANIVAGDSSSRPPRVGRTNSAGKCVRGFAGDTRGVHRRAGVEPQIIAGMQGQIAGAGANAGVGVDTQIGRRRRTNNDEEFPANKSRRPLRPVPDAIADRAGDVDRSGGVESDRRRFAAEAPGREVQLPGGEQTPCRWC